MGRLSLDLVAVGSTTVEAKKRAHRLWRVQAPEGL
jgi:hypothetical protein